MEKDKPEEASFYKPLSAAGRPNPPTWTTALAWAVLGLIIGSALASVVLDPLNRAGVAKTSFDPARARQQQAPSSEHDQNVPGAAAAAGQLAMDMPLDAARPASRKAWQSWADVDTIFCFGDEYTSTHFNVTEEPQPSAEFPFGNRDAAPLENQNDTMHWINYMRDRYGKSKPVVYNIAAAGALTSPRALGPAARTDAGPSFNEQIDIFRRFNETRPPFRMYWKQPGNVRWDERRTLFTIWFGISDFVSAIDAGVALPIDPLLSSYAAGMERLYSAGARAMLLLNVPPVHRMVATPATVEEREVELDTLNSRIASLRRRFLLHHPDATIFHLDVAALFKKALEDPAAFSQTERLRALDRFCESYATGADPPDRWDPDCEFSLDEHFWLDERHVTPTIHDFVAAVAVENCFNHNDGPRFYCT